MVLLDWPLKPIASNYEARPNIEASCSSLLKHQRDKGEVWCCFRAHLHAENDSKLSTLERNFLSRLFRWPSFELEILCISVCWTSTRCCPLWMFSLSNREVLLYSTSCRGLSLYIHLYQSRANESKMRIYSMDIRSNSVEMNRKHSTITSNSCNSMVGQINLNWLPSELCVCLVNLVWHRGLCWAVESGSAEGGATN